MDIFASGANLFKLLCIPSAWMSSGCTRSLVWQRCIRWKQRRCAAAFTSILSTSLSFFSLRQDDYIVYRGLFFYHRLPHGPVYTRNTDDRLVEPHCFMFLPGSLAFSIHHLSKLILHSHVCRCYKSQIHWYNHRYSHITLFTDRNNIILSSSINI